MFCLGKRCHYDLFRVLKTNRYHPHIYANPPPPHPPLCSLVPSPMLALDLLLVLQFIWMCEERKQVSDGHSRSGNSKGQVSKRKNASVEQCHVTGSYSKRKFRTRRGFQLVATTTTMSSVGLPFWAHNCLLPTSARQRRTSLASTTMVCAFCHSLLRFLTCFS